MSQANLKLYHGQPAPETAAPIQVRNLNVWFGDRHILRDVHADFLAHRINGIIGPSGSGKSTLVRCLNRMNDEVEGFTAKGTITLDGRNILAPGVDAAQLRQAVGMVFQKPCVFPRSIAENVLFGVQNRRKLSRTERSARVEETLRAVALWNEVQHRLLDPAASLSLGQQQRLCLARTLAIKPRVILLDEPTSSLDPVSARAIEDLMLALKERYTLVFVTHNIQQARRVADHLVFLCNGRVIEQGPKEQLFQHPQREATRKYLNEEYCDC